MAACSEVSFSPTRTARPSSDRSKMYAWSRASKSLGVRTTTVAMARKSTCPRVCMIAVRWDTGRESPNGSATRRRWPDCGRAWRRRCSGSMPSPPTRARSTTLPSKLPVLQNRLHWAGELVAGIEPPPGAERSHAELAGALEHARDATGEVRETLDTGGHRGGVAPRARVARGAVRSAAGAPPARARRRASRCSRSTRP